MSFEERKKRIKDKQITDFLRKENNLKLRGKKKAGGRSEKERWMMSDDILLVQDEEVSNYGQNNYVEK